MDIQLSHVKKSFGKTLVIKDLSFAITAGEICCLLGPSGSGKTTLISLMIGALPADSGTIRFGDTEMPDMAVLKRLGFMPQNDALYDDLSAYGNLKFFGGLYPIKKQALDARITEVLDIVELTDHRKKLVKNFSGGMKKRLSLAIAILHKPDILFLDEPTAGIDPVLRRKIWKQFQSFKAQGTTIVVSTHVMDEVIECDKGALLYNGQLIEYDTVPKLLDKTASGRIEDLFFAASESEARS
ncbi:ABC transporter ATP-binding protein [Planococcus maritimus]|uniref:ABC transporter ATP-binding protein n=1 Tax=Planococcus maritimus TaxID=192421 RepID=A0A7D7RHE1_PLAMR|nr:ABC transporter ATP-binding protein [Planococcus maritimus]QMT17203.1 ABC transporter ATP-binding protein [Planococcus maritimus]